MADDGTRKIPLAEFTDVVAAPANAWCLRHKETGEYYTINEPDGSKTTILFENENDAHAFIAENSLQIAQPVPFESTKQN